MGRHRLVPGRDDERVSLLVRRVVIMREYDVLERLEEASDVFEGESAHLDEVKEHLGAEHTVALVQVAHVPVGGDRTWHIEELRWNWASAQVQSCAL
jgi:hypothetical protein